MPILSLKLLLLAGLFVTATGRDPLHLRVSRLEHGGCDLTWRPLPGAIGYVLFRKRPPSAPPERLTPNPIDTTAFRDSTSGTGPLFYRVVAHLYNGKVVAGPFRWVPGRAVSP